MQGGLFLEVDNLFAHFGFGLSFCQVLVCMLLPQILQKRLCALDYYYENLID